MNKIAILCNICTKPIDFPKEKVVITASKNIMSTINPNYTHRTCFDKENERKVAEYGKK